MSDVRRKDKKGRILREGEYQLKDGRYRFRYRDIKGCCRDIYSWRLEKNDVTQLGRKSMLSLREMEIQIFRDGMDQLVANGGNLTVLKLVEMYIETRTNVRPTTRAGYGTVINILKKDDFGKKRIDQIRSMDAKAWFIKLQKKDGRSYSSIHSIRGVLRPAFEAAYEDYMIRRNPFSFQLSEVIVNDSVRREALTPEEERKFLEFVKEDSHFSRYYDGIYILFKTGLRISEFCGLTLKDIDFTKHRITIDHQLQKRSKIGYYIEKTKTTCGIRILPMTPDVEECFRKIVSNRRPPKPEPMVDGRVGFLYFDKDGSIMYSLHWEHYFRRICQKYNGSHQVQMPKVTPHVCRHTYCSNMAKSGMSPKTLQYLMGHADIDVTLNTYTHMDYDHAEEEVFRLLKVAE